MGSQKAPIAVARGDGIGPEIMQATLDILEASGAQLEIHEVEIGEKCYLKGCLSGIEPATWETIRNTKAFLKAPITTPQGGGFKSLNVTVRTTLGLYANVRPAISYAPFVATKHPNMNVVIVRENEEDLYTGIEYRQTPEVYQSLKLITRPGSEKIIRYAFEYAKEQGRKKVTCFTKDNIMKISDGLFHDTYEEIAKEYPDIESEHWIIDIGTAKLADTPEAFDVIVLPNLYGDILSDVAAQISGSVGLAGSANIGDHGAMFEAIHGSAPRRAGQNVANPSGIILGSVFMLVHLEQMQAATTVHNAWLRTIEDGVHTYDIFKEGVSTQKVGTKEFAKAVIDRLGKSPEKLTPISYHEHNIKKHKSYKMETINVTRDLVGIDVFMFDKETAENFQKKLISKNYGSFELTMITNRGAKIYPDGHPETFCVDHWRCRFLAKESTKQTQRDLASLIMQLAEEGFDIIKTENLYNFDGKPAYSSAEG
ncbi:isocitrate dehydrogenase [Candidatus Aerophobetes bacterium]|uniref:Isocitrate dehydrogenase [NADP] n=1 Tax=Aerophobetes bacterium TaxID=2030807 RepID=A0A2A4YCQ3_UNCAE|nr:MAG: isocitrate dehydrogenase [Candidatus Aerophobetes bacterium]